MISIETKDSNVVFIGKKDIMVYVSACVTQFNKGSNEIILKARGLSMAKAIDLSQLIVNKFKIDTEIKDIKIATEEIEGTNDETKEKYKTNVSSIEITIGPK